MFSEEKKKIGHAMGTINVCELWKWLKNANKIVTILEKIFETLEKIVLLRYSAAQFYQNSLHHFFFFF